MDALFYPALSLPGPAWTNPNLLFFEQIGVIAPQGEESDFFDGPTRLLMKHRLVTPVSPLRYAHDDEDDERVIDCLKRLAVKPPRSRRLARVHLGKISHTALPEALINMGLLRRSDQHYWLEGPDWVVDFVMSTLATRMASNPRLDVSLVTNLAYAEQLVSGAQDSERVKTNRRVRAVSRLLPIGPDAELDEILQFRERHSRELRAFRGFIEGLIRRSASDAQGEADFDARLHRAEELRAHLVGELDTVGSGPILPIMLSVTSIAAPTLEASPYSAAAGVLGLGYLIYTQSSAARRTREARRDKLVYAAIAEKTFAARRAEDILR